MQLMIAMIAQSSYNAINAITMEFDMATNLVVRNVDEDIALALKQLAAAHGRSAEAEHREILKSALQRPKRRSLAEVLSNMPNIGEDSDFDCRTV
jgi:plasmid stability protein